MMQRPPLLVAVVVVTLLAVVAVLAAFVFSVLPVLFPAVAVIGVLRLSMVLLRWEG